ncbi:ABC transporter ATP-binding protein, partial [Blautia sp.]
MNILQTRNLTKYYGKEPLLVKALDGINMEIEQGNFTAIVGRSGSGKSTLLHMLGGLDCPTGGSVMVDGQELSGLDSNELTIFRRRKIGFVFQNFNLMPNLNIYDNIVLPVELD